MDVYSISPGLLLSSFELLFACCKVKPSSPNSCKGGFMLLIDVCCQLHRSVHRSLRRTLVRPVLYSSPPVRSVSSVSKLHVTGLIKPSPKTPYRQYRIASLFFSFQQLLNDRPGFPVNAVTRFRLHPLPCRAHDSLPVNNIGCRVPCTEHLGDTPAI